MKLVDKRENNCPKQWWSALAQSRIPPQQHMFSDLLWSNELPLKNLGWAVLTLLKQGFNFADSIMCGWWWRPWNACLWASTLFTTPQRELQWGVPGHKKWSSSWGLDYFTWKTQASFLPASICQWDRTYCSPEWGWLYSLHCLPLEFWDSAAGHYCSLFSSLLPISPAQPGLLELIIHAHNSESSLWGKYFSTCLLPVNQWNLTAGIYTALTFQGTQSLQW